VSLSIGKDSVSYPQPETYYTDLLRIQNPTAAPIVISAVALSGIRESRSGDIGTITVYYCAAQTDDPISCGASFGSSTTGGGTVFSGADTLGPGATRYIEFAGFAGPSAHVGDSISFVIEVTAS
jgi:hypothetical protein